MNDDMQYSGTVSVLCFMEAFVICDYIKICSINNSCFYICYDDSFYVYAGTYIHYYVCDNVTERSRYMAFLSQHDSYLN